MIIAGTILRIERQARDASGRPLPYAKLVLAMLCKRDKLLALLNVAAEAVVVAGKASNAAQLACLREGRHCCSSLVRQEGTFS